MLDVRAQVHAQNAVTPKGSLPRVLQVDASSVVCCRRIGPVSWPQAIRGHGGEPRSRPVWNVQSSFAQAVQLASTCMLPTCTGQHPIVCYTKFEAWHCSRHAPLAKRGPFTCSYLHAEVLEALDVWHILTAAPRSQDLSTSCVLWASSTSGIT